MYSMSPDHYLAKAEKYGLLADYYKYINPTLHIYYYKKHYNNIQKAVASERSAFTDSTPEQQAKIRLLHVAPDAPNVDIYVNGTRIIKDFPYKSVTDYLALPKGKYQMDIYPTGNQISTIISRKIIVESGKSYTLATVGSENNLKLLTYHEEFNVPNGEAKLRFIHLSPETAPMDLAVKHADCVFTNIPFRKSTNYLGVTPMTLDLEARLSGTETIALEIPNTEFMPNTIHSIYIIGLENERAPLEALILSP
ncbi:MULTISPECIES: DUF4397 domain-containing protein [Bacillus]|uniref:DUF4397 domain-containing protein n=1 Tax=Bacillus TaxID=1386 RepID=UPI0002D4B63D|nr:MULTISPECIES: DUF4397 domain-containing protein [Bacillus]